MLKQQLTEAVTLFMVYNDETTTHTEEVVTQSVVNDVEKQKKLLHSPWSMMLKHRKKLLHSLWSTMMKQQLTQIDYNSHTLS
jgi:hypothetical protein